MANQDFIHITHPRYLLHDTGGGDHPELPARIEVIGKRLAGKGWPEKQPSPAGRESLLTIHSEEYLLRFEETALAGQSYLGHPDNQLGYETYEIAQLAAGAGLAGILALEAGEASKVFCSVRPPGHHAEESMALGFCFLNNVAIAARFWQRQFNRQRIAIIDIDAHHGNGIQAAFEEDPDIFYISIHEHPTFSFPGTGYAEETGTDAGRGFTLNIPLLPGAGDSEVRAAFTGQVEPVLRQFRPEVLIVAAGFDAQACDDMSGLRYSTGIYGEIGRRIASLAGECCQNKVLSILEGGYHLPSLADSVEAYCLGLIEEK